MGSRGPHLHAGQRHAAVQWQVSRGCDLEAHFNHTLAPFFCGAPESCVHTSFSFGLESLSRSYQVSNARFGTWDFAPVVKSSAKRQQPPLATEALISFEALLALVRTTWRLNRCQFVLQGLRFVCGLTSSPGTLPISSSAMTRWQTRL